MLEARLGNSKVLKGILDAIGGLVQDANWDCSSSGITLQAMDSAHVSLISLLLRSDGFDSYRCDRNTILGMNMVPLSKIIKCAGNEDIVTLSSEEGGDTVTLKFEAQNQERISEYEMKLMDIDSEHLGIPDTKHQAMVKMPANEFQRICRDLSTMGDSISIAVKKEGVKFEAAGETGTGTTTLRPTTSVDEEKDEITIDLKEEVSLNFAARYLNLFTKATGLAETVTLSMSEGTPLVVEYQIGTFGYIRYYLAPKLDEEEE